MDEKDRKSILYDKEIKVDGLVPLKMSDFTKNTVMNDRVLAAYLINLYDRVEELEKELKEVKKRG